MRRAGIGDCEIEAEVAWHPIPSPGDWRKIVRGTGVIVLRSTVHNQKGALCMEGKIRLRVAKRDWKSQK